MIYPSRVFRNNIVNIIDFASDDVRLDPFDAVGSLQFLFKYGLFSGAPALRVSTPTTLYSFTLRRFTIYKNDVTRIKSELDCPFISYLKFSNLDQCFT